MNKTPKLRFKEFNGDWESKKLGNLLEFKNGINASKEQYGHGEKFINVLDILNNNYITHENIIGKVDVDKSTFEKYSVGYGDVVFQRSSETREEVGTANVYLDKENKATFGGFIIRGKKIGEYDPIFMNKLLKSSTARKEITTKSGGSTRYNVGQDTLSDVSLLFPKLEEQEKIASFFSLIDDKISLQGDKVEALKDYKKGMMQKIFSRELRFKDDEGRDYPEWEDKKLGELDILLVRGPFGSSLTKSIMVLKGNNTYKVYEQKHAIQKDCNIGTYYVNQDKYHELKRFAVKPHDYIMSCSGTIGELYKIPNDAEAGIINQALLKITVGKIIDENYFLYAFRYNLNNLETKGSGIKNITSVKFLKDEFEIPTPSIQEQRKIAKFLINIDKKLEKEQEKLDSLNEYKKGLLQQMFV